MYGTLSVSHTEIRNERDFTAVKNKILLIVLAIAIFIPTVVAIVSYNTTNTEPVSEKNVRAVSLSDLAGETFTFTRGENDEMLDFFLEMNRSSVKVSSLPDPLVGTAFFKLTMLSSKNEESFQYYFQKDSSEAYYLDSSGTAYKIPASFVQKFVGGKYAACLYDSAKAPVLSVSGQTDVVPHAAAWFFKNNAGTYVSSDVTVSKEPLALSLTGGLSFAFSLQPDYCSVKLTDTDTGAGSVGSKTKGYGSRP
jgi:hypothetical protein